MKKIIAVILALLLLFSLAACGGKTTDAPATNPPAASGGESKAGSSTDAGSSTSASENTPAPAPAESSAPAESAAPLNPMEGVSVDVGKKEVTITVPADFKDMDSEQSEEEIRAEALEEGITDVVFNEDGSVTYTMTAEKHEEMLKEMADEIDTAIAELTEGEEAVAAFKSITSNSDYSRFEIAVDPEELAEYDSFSAMVLALLGATYQVYSGNQEPDSIAVLKDANTGEELDQVSYADWAAFLESLMGFGEDGEGWDWGDAEWDWGEDSIYTVELPEIESQVLVDYEGFTVTADGFVTEDFWGQGLSLSIENNSDRTILLENDCFVVNGFEMSSWIYNSYAPGETAAETLYFSSDELKAGEITAIGKIDVQFTLYDEETYDELFSTDELVILTSDYDADWDKAPQGEDLYSSDGILIRYLGAEEDETWGSITFAFYFENMNDFPVNISDSGMKLSGEDFDAWLYKGLRPGMRGIAAVSFYDHELEEAGLTEVDSAEIIFEAQNDETYDTLFITESLALSLGE